MNVLIWATTFGADLWSLAKYLDERPDVTTKIVMANPSSYLSQPVAKLHPLRAEIIARRPHQQLLGVSSFRPDVTILDNRVPLRAPSPACLVLWHGFGWKGPDDLRELRWLHRQLRITWGGARRSNPKLGWLCFGPSDRDHRTTVSGIARDNCVMAGAASHDDLRSPVDRTRVAHAYPFDICRRKTVLIAPTWHYGQVFAHWGSDPRIFDELLNHIEQLGANAIVRMHDSFRFASEYREAIEGIVGRHRHAILKYKDHAPDNYLDMQISDVLVTNFSSIANLFYATRRPTIHVYPVRSEDEVFMFRSLSWTGVRERKVPSVRFMWKFPPEQNGGLLARTKRELLEQLDQALAEPSCCAERAQQFLDQHMMGADGQTCRRIGTALNEIVRA